MSNQARLILLSGVGGSGTTSLASATAAAASDEGLSCVVVDATRVHDDADAMTSAAVAALVAGLQAEALPSESWSGLASVAQLAAWQQIQAAVSQSGTDVVVVDGGSLREVQALVLLPQVLERLLTAALTPTLAMRRVADTAGDQQAVPAFDRLAAVRDSVAQMVATMENDRTTLRLVTVPEENAVSQTLRAMSRFALLGIGVDAVVVNRFARKADSREQRDAQQVQMDRIEAYDAGVRVWKSTTDVRAIPKGRSVLGPLGDPAALRGDFRPRVEEEGYLLDLPLTGDARREARVGRAREFLVVEFDGIHRWIRLPSVLLRCRATHATRTPTGVTVAFVPDASLWRTAPDEGSAA